MVEWWERFDSLNVVSGEPETLLNDAKLEGACRHLLGCCLLHLKPHRMELRDWVYGDALYDQIPVAEEFGLARHLAQRPLVTWAYLHFVFFAAMDSLEARGLARLEEKQGQYSCVLTKEGRSLAKKYDSHLRDRFARGGPAR